MQDSAFAIILRRSRILLVKAHHKDHWQLPGGRLERGESSREALLREIEEETGLEATVDRLIGTFRRDDGSVAKVFLARASGTLAGETREIEAQRWVSTVRAQLLVSETTSRRLRRVLPRTRGAG